MGKVSIGDASVWQGKADMVFTHPYAPLPKCLHGLPIILTDIPPDDYRPGVHGSHFLNCSEAQIRGTAGSRIPGITNGAGGSDLAIFAGIWTHSSHLLLLNA
jgi:hypothetical protein